MCLVAWPWAGGIVSHIISVLLCVYSCTPSWVHSFNHLCIRSCPYSSLNAHSAKTLQRLLWWAREPTARACPRGLHERCGMWRALGCCDYDNFVALPVLLLGAAQRHRQWATALKEGSALYCVATLPSWSILKAEPLEKVLYSPSLFLCSLLSTQQAQCCSTFCNSWLSQAQLALASKARGQV